MRLGAGGRWQEHQWGWTRLILILLAVALLTGCSRGEVFRHEAFVFGTRVDVAVFGDSQAAADAASDRASAVRSGFLKPAAGHRRKPGASRRRVA